MKIAILGVSGNGKTTLARRLSRELHVPHVELDALVHQPGWREADDETVRQRILHVLAERDRQGWVIDGNYEAKLGDVRGEIYKRADVVVWLDLSLPRILGRLLHRVAVDLLTNRDLFNGNRQTLRFAFFVPDSLFGYAIKMHGKRRKSFPEAFARHGIEAVRLRSPREVEAWVQSILSSSSASASASITKAAGQERERVDQNP